MTAAPSAAGGGFHEFADLDPRAAQLAVLPSLSAARRLVATLDEARARPVVWQVWFGAETPAMRRNVALWREYCAALGYAHRLVGAHNYAAYLAAETRARIADALAEAERRACYPLVANVLRYALLFEHGGLYVDVDHRPPSVAARWIPLSGFVGRDTPVTCVTENRYRCVGQDCSTYYGNNLMYASAPRLPAMRRVLDACCESIPNYVRAHAGALDSFMAAGPTLVTRALATTIKTVVPLALLRAWGVVDYAPDAACPRPCARAHPTTGECDCLAQPVDDDDEYVVAG